MAKKRTRKSVEVKEQAVLRLLKGEDLELVSRQTGVALHELSRWRDKFIAAGRCQVVLLRLSPARKTEGSGA